jgi:hypothetical protein
MGFAPILKLVDEHASLGDVARLLAAASLKSSGNCSVEDESDEARSAQRAVDILRNRLGLPKELSPLSEAFNGFAAELLNLARAKQLPIWSSQGFEMLEPGLGGRISVRDVLDWLRGAVRPGKGLLIDALEPYLDRRISEDQAEGTTSEDQKSFRDSRHDPKSVKAAPILKSEQCHVVKKDELIEIFKRELEWPSIRVCLAEASRNGLRAAAHAGRHGMWDVDKARAWAVENFKIRPPVASGLPNSPWSAARPHKP